MLRPFFQLGLLALAVACATSPLGRRQLMIFPEAEMARMGATAYDQMKSKLPPSRDAALNAGVRCVAGAITAELDSPWKHLGWEVTVFEEPSPNAFALPGGKIGVHTGLMEVARNQDQLATVLGHEVAHVVAGHANERVSTAFATQTGLDLAAALSGAASPTQRQLLGLLGLGAQIGVILPFSRTQEREADLLGLDLMAKAGFDPRQSVQPWRNMSAAGGARPPEFLSTHPSHGTRIQELSQRMPSAALLREGARAQGRQPSCD